MIVVSDTSPLNYLVLIGADHVLPRLFGKVLAPPMVLSELQRAKAPQQVQSWANNPPQWLEIRSPKTIPKFPALDPGEAAAIALAQELKADAVLIDERDGTKVAKRLGLNATSTLAILGLAAEQRLLSLPIVIAELRRTTFRGPAKLIEEMLRIDEARRSRDTSQTHEGQSE
jgi:predicted nucleic acid-binding protein